MGSRGLGLASSTALKYIQKEPDMATTTLAKILAKKEKPLFTSVEHARGVIKVLRGQSGPLLRKTMLDRGVYLAPSQFEAMFISFMHTDEDLEKTIKANYNALVASGK